MANRLGSGWSNNGIFAIDGLTPKDSFEEVGMRANDVGSDDLHTLGVPILQGRDIGDADTRQAPKVAIVNETFVKRFFRTGRFWVIPWAVQNPGIRSRSSV